MFLFIFTCPPYYAVLVVGGRDKVGRTRQETQIQGGHIIESIAPK